MAAAPPQAETTKAAPANAAAAKRGPGRPPKGTDTGLRVREMAVADLVPHPRNARTHSPASIDKLAAHISKLGWTSPILVAGKNILAGHARRLAAMKLGRETVPTIDLSRLSKVQRLAVMLSDNRLALDGGWNEGYLIETFEELLADGYDLSLTGFDQGELTDFLGDPVAEGLTDPDDVPEAPIEPVSVLGDVWLLGRHRLVCGDSTTVEAVDAALAGVKPHLMVTDPPYGVEYDADWRNKALRADGTAIGGRAIGKVENDTRADWSEAWALFPGDVAYVWHGALQTSTVLDSLGNSGLEARALIIWAKQQFVISRGHYHNQHEPCWYAVRKGETGHWSGDRTQSTLWQIDKPHKSETGHSTQKPVECMKRPIENNSSPGQAVYEPFSGSGTTIIAAEMTGRACIGIEIAPAYVDVAVRRWMAFTGAEATHAETGRSFTETAAERAATPAVPTAAE